ncbi:hypothetical protein TNCT_248841 [Trichonephila clavata]|uniref:Uncharacterized protein n=1 Tax=Trichonephila clavata TaxID=2740835 RepID=A0A8X6IST9_TRICU|nr:hypothetical protein TNCT_248841 [Trichonephila clavata]
MMGISTASCVEMSRVEGPGPLHQSSQAARVFASKPRERASAGLHSEGMCRHWKSFDNCWIWETVGNECFQQLRRGVNP